MCFCTIPQYNMKKFNELEYKRPDFSAEEESAREYVRKIKEVKSYKELKNLYLSEQSRYDWFATMQSIASIRNSLDTSDQFYENEVQQFYMHVPSLMLIYQEADRLILNSPYLVDFSKDFPETFTKDMEMNQKLSSEDVASLLSAEAGLEQEYARIISECTVVFQNRVCNLYGIQKFFQHTDRRVRKSAYSTWAELYEKTAPQLDGLFSKLIRLRVDIAKKLGFSDYTKYRYASLHRYDYNQDDVSCFREQIKKYVVPICEEEFVKQRDRLGVETLFYYDESIYFRHGNAVPNGTPLEMIEKAGQMYHELSPETGECFDFIRKYELYDFVSRKGKQPGSYSTYLPLLRAPFMFSNFNGTNDDVDVLTHEAGHAFAAFESGKTGVMTDYIFPNYEIAEIHSMTMELITYPWMDLFFGNLSDDYKTAHLSNALTGIPYLACVDEFQHKIYENPEMTGAERRTIWKELEKEYMPWRNYDGNEFLESGGFWMEIQHVFLYPFYYIEYAFAQMSAFEFYEKFCRDRKSGWRDYYNLCCVGGTKGYFDTLEHAGLSNPFKEDTVKRIMHGIRFFLDFKCL